MGQLFSKKTVPSEKEIAARLIPVPTPVASAAAPALVPLSEKIKALQASCQQLELDRLERERKELAGMQKDLKKSLDDYCAFMTERPRSTRK